MVLLIVLVGIEGCATGRMPRPQACAPRPERMVCNEGGIDWLDKDALRFLCYRPEEIEPFLERCGADAPRSPAQ